MFCRSCGAEIPDAAGFCPGCGAPTGAGAVQPIMQPQATTKSSSTAVIAIVLVVVGVGMFIVIGILAAIAIPNFMYAKSKSQYSVCLESLSNVGKGLQSYMAENETLNGIDQSAEAACNHIIPGHDTAKTCYGMVKKRVEQSCEVGTFSVTHTTNFTYEVTAKAMDKTHCPICVTEVGYTPTTYSECRTATTNTPVCKH